MPNKLVKKNFLQLKLPFDHPLEKVSYFLLLIYSTYTEFSASSELKIYI